MKDTISVFWVLSIFVKKKNSNLFAKQWISIGMRMEKNTLRIHLRRSSVIKENSLKIKKNNKHLIKNGG